MNPLLAATKKHLEKYLADSDEDINEVKDIIDAAHMRKNMKVLDQKMRNQLDRRRIFQKQIDLMVSRHYKAAVHHINYKCVNTNEKDMWDDYMEAANLYLELEITEPTTPLRPHILSLDASEIGNYMKDNVALSFTIKLDGKIICSYDPYNEKSDEDVDNEGTALIDLHSLLQRITGFDDDDVICFDDWNVFIVFLLSQVEMPYYSSRDMFKQIQSHFPRMKEDSNSDITD